VSAIVAGLIRALTKKGMSPDDIADVIAEIGELDFQLPPVLKAKRAPKDVHPDFESWWSCYPRHKARGAAERAFATAMTRTSLDTLMAATQRFYRECAGKDAQFIPHGATWLNAKSWLDEADHSPTGATATVISLDRVLEAKAKFQKQEPDLFGETY
jgi:hypothetical protein